MWWGISQVLDILKPLLGFGFKQAIKTNLRDINGCYFF